MTLSAAGVWYFSRDGQHSGPLTYAEIKEKADRGLLRPRTDLVWKEGMNEWRSVGEIEGLFREKGIDVPSTPPMPVAQGAVSPMADPYAEGEQQEFGGCHRRSYFFVVFILPALAGLFFTSLKSASPDLLPSDVWGLIAQYGPIVLLLFVLFTIIQRFANLGMSRWWILGNLVPFLNLWTGYRCFACPEGYAVHKKMDGVGIFLAIFYWFFLICFIVIVAITFAVLAGAAGSPEIQKQLKEVLAQLGVQIENQVK